jgi:exopolysaccharide biosynthesis polyprenyl glycosylphosphotransferase
MTLSSLSNKILSYRIANEAEGRKKYLYLFELFIIGLVYLLSVYAWKRFIEPQLIVDIDFYTFGGINLLLWRIIYKFTVIAKVPRTQRYLQILFQFVRVSFMAGVTLILLKLILGLSSIPFLFILFYISLNLFVIFKMRLLSYVFFKTYRASGHDLHQVIVLADWYSDSFIEKILEEKEWGFNISKVITNSTLIKRKYGKQLEILPESADIKNIIDNEVVDEVLYCKGLIDENKIKELAGICNEIGVIFRMQSNLSPLEDLHLQLKTLNSTGQLNLVDTPSNSISLLFKQVSDIYFSFTMLMFLAPVFFFIGMIIKLDSRGPIFFKQERVGLRGRRFMLYKFRTMVNDAEKLLEKLHEKNEADGPVFKIKSDPRITRIGQFLRKTGLDELPQLYNVFIGEMSLIGPRPPLPSEVAKYERWQLRRLSVKPGITCTWQIVPNRNNVKFEKWMRLDLQYIDNWSLYKDASLFVRTILTFFTAPGH